MNNQQRAMELLEQQLSDDLLQDMEPRDVYVAAVRAIKALLDEVSE